MTDERKVAKKTEDEFKKKAGKETFKESAVDASLDRMAGSSQDITDRGTVREKLRRAARDLDKR
ncbi:MAG TPA: hypothetical protein VHM01_16325 [Alphaproteobacteria bacterium]|nr:hypothetical protein [Alphaproteobacteria bacterium]